MKTPPETMHDTNGTFGAKPAQDGGGVRASLVMSLSAFAVAQGVSRERMFAVTGLSPADLLEPGGRVPELSFHRLWQLVGAHCPNQAIALKLAEVAPMTEHGVLMHAVRYAQDSRTALELFVRYSVTLAASIEAQLIEGARVTRLRIHHPLDEIDGGHAVEMALALVARLGREVFGSAHALTRVESRFPRHGPEQVYRDYFQVPCQFQCRHSALVFHSQALSIPAPSGNAATFSFLQQHLDLVRAQLVSEADPNVADGPRADPDNLAEGETLRQIRQAVADNAVRGEYSAEALARRLGTSLRTLQRRLRDHGVTVSSLLEQARAASARQLLSDRRLSVEEIAFLLNYSSARSFRRACMRWTGKTPAELR